MDSVPHSFGLPATPARREQQPGGVTGKRGPIHTLGKPVQRVPLEPFRTFGLGYEYETPVLRDLPECDSMRPATGRMEGAKIPDVDGYPARVPLGTGLSGNARTGTTLSA